MKRGVRWACAAIALVFGAGAGCTRDETSLGDGASATQPSLHPSVDAEVDETPSLAALRAYETHRREGADLTRYDGAEARLGAEPYAIVAVPGAEPRFAVLLRHADAVVLFDHAFREIARTAAPRLASGLATDAKGRLFVGGEGSEVVLAYDVIGDAFVARGSVTLPRDTSVRAIAVRPSDDAVVVADEIADVVHVEVSGKRRSVPVPRGPNRLAVVNDTVFVVSLVEHAISAVAAKGDAKVLVRIDGPIFGFDVARRGEGWDIVAGHIEDHPLDRRGGSFGYVDSFVSRYHCDATLRCELARRVNVGELDVVTPRIVAHDEKGHVVVTGYGSPRALVLDESSLDVVSSWAAPPGIAAVVVDATGLVFVSPLLDAIGHVGADGQRLVRLASPQRRASSRLGELLFYTTLLAPWQRSEGELSRFTCESCHFEGLTDGRTHATGRGDVRATTKPLRGLFTNGPHFTRALDHDLSQVVHAEFRVAAARSDHDAWFRLDEIPPTARAILDSAKIDEADLASLSSPEASRRAFVDFLIDFAPAPNPFAVRRTAWSPLERRGAEVFRDTCRSCHAARLVANDPSTEVPFEAWERHIMSAEGPIVWAREGYEKTGVEPYVADAGARPTSLRRTVRKRVYMTNGGMSSLEAVVKAVSFGRDSSFLHASPDDGLRSLEADEQAALVAFMRLL